MPGIRKRKDGRYEIRKMENGQRISLYARSEKEAQTLLNKLKKNKIKIKPKVIEEKPKTQALTQWFQEWIEIYKKPFVNEKSLKEIESSLKPVLKVFGNKQINEIAPTEIQRFLNGLEQNRSKERIQLYFNALLQKATDLDIIKKNPFKAVQKSKKKKYKNNTYTYEEQIKILNAIKSSNIEHEIITYLMTGARPNEFPKKENFDFENNVVIINGTKNESSKRRVIEMSIDYSNFMKEFLKKQSFKTHKEIQTEFKNLCVKNNIQTPLLYRLRHTFASNHFILGTPAKQVSEWMGHSSITITLDTYTDIDKTITKEKIKKLYNNFYYTVK